MERFLNTTRVFRVFFKLTCSESHIKVADSLRIVYFVFDAIMRSPRLASKFKGIAEQRFLMHLIAHHCIILHKNSFGYEKDGAYIHELSLLTSFFNHSCLPNVAKLSKANISVCKSIMPIKKDAQLFLCYIAEEVFSMTEKERNDQLDISYEFRCKCELCKYGTLRAQNLELDPSFAYVVANVKKAEFDDKTIQDIIHHCVQFLTEHTNMIRSQELHYIADILNAMFSKVINV